MRLFEKEDGASFMPVLKNKKANFEKLAAFGFKREGKDLVFRTSLAGGMFQTTVSVSDDGVLRTQTTDADTLEPYDLHLVEGVTGVFVGKLREEYDAFLNGVVERCFDENVFKSVQAVEIIDFIAREYRVSPEFLWAKFPDNAVFRKKANAKWFAALLTVEESKVRTGGTGKIEIVDLKMRAGERESLIDNEKYYAGWHMNKKTWFTICLDGSVPTGEIFDRIRNSYELAV